MGHSEPKAVQTPVVTGFYVLKFWTEGDEKKARAKNKRVSKTFTARSAAEDFKALCERSVKPVEGERDVYYTVANEVGFDNIPGGV